MAKLRIAYGSESGNAHALAYQLKLKCLGLSAEFSELDELSLNDLSKLTTDDVLLVVTSTTGNGEAPSNANKFYQALARNQSGKERIQASFNFAVFGIGDVKYDNFCGFSAVVDGLLTRVGATALSKRVDADVDYEAFFEEWSTTIVSYLKAKDADSKQQAYAQLQALDLQVVPNT